MKKVKATCAIITNQKNQILLVKRGREPFIHHWALPSGIGEALKGFPVEKAVLGEVDCDLQTLLIKPKRLFALPVVDDRYVDGTVVFTGQIEESKINLHPPYSLAYKWFSKEEIDKLPLLAFEHREIITRYFKKID